MTNKGPYPGKTWDGTQWVAQVDRGSDDQEFIEAASVGWDEWDMTPEEYASLSVRTRAALQRILDHDVALLKALSK